MKRRPRRWGAMCPRVGHIESGICGPMCNATPFIVLGGDGRGRSSAMRIASARKKTLVFERTSLFCNATKALRKLRYATQADYALESHCAHKLETLPPRNDFVSVICTRRRENPRHVFHFKLGFLCVPLGFPMHNGGRAYTYYHLTMLYCTANILSVCIYISTTSKARHGVGLQETK